MTKRREILQLGLGASVASFLPLSLHANNAAAVKPQSSAHSFTTVLYDLRLPESHQQAKSLIQRLDIAQPAITLRGLSGNVGAYWYQELNQLWSSGHTGLAGCTAPDMLFCLQQLARDHRQRLVWHEQINTQDVHGESMIAWVIA